MNYKNIDKLNKLKDIIALNHKRAFILNFSMFFIVLVLCLYENRMLSMIAPLFLIFQYFYLSFLYKLPLTSPFYTGNFVNKFLLKINIETAFSYLLELRIKSEQESLSVEENMSFSYIFEYLNTTNDYELLGKLKKHSLYEKDLYVKTAIDNRLNEVH